MRLRDKHWLCQVSVPKLSGAFQVLRGPFGLCTEALCWTKYGMLYFCLQGLIFYIMPQLHDPFVTSKQKYFSILWGKQASQFSLIRLDSFVFPSCLICFSKVIPFVLPAICCKHLCACLW